MSVSEHGSPARVDGGDRHGITSGQGSPPPLAAASSPRLCDDGHGWLAQVEFSARYDWGWGKHLDCVPPERLRLPAVQGGPFFQ